MTQTAQNEEVLASKTEVNGQKNVSDINENDNDSQSKVLPVEVKEPQGKPELDNNRRNSSHSSKSSNHDHYRIIFETIGKARKWDDFVLLFILIADVHRQFDFSQTAQILDNLTEYYEGRVIDYKIFKEVKSILVDYKYARKENDEPEREKIRKFIFESLRLFENETNDWDTFQNLVRELDDDEQRRLRWICVNQIPTLLHFAGSIRKSFPGGRSAFYSWMNNNNNFADNDKITNDKVTTEDYNNNSQTTLQAMQSKHDKSLKETKKKLANAELKIERLEKQLRTLTKEASEHQAALGRITNVDWKDDDPNNSVQLSKDIENLQNLLLEFTSVKGSNYQLDMNAARNFLHGYKCNIEMYASPLDLKTAVSAALQRHAIQIILDEIKTYLAKSNQLVQESSDDQKLEIDIVSKTDELSHLIENFSEKRPGDDKFTPLAPAKLRQQVFAILGSRAFSITSHPFIESLTSNLINFMNQFRQVKSEELSRGLPARATQIIREIICLFEFRLKTQPQVPDIVFYDAGTPLNPLLMEGSWDSTEGVVDICSFPVIGINLDKPNPHIFCKARVLSREK